MFFLGIFILRRLSSLFWNKNSRSGIANQQIKFTDMPVKLKEPSIENKYNK